jgi:hypothetical protein
MVTQMLPQQYFSGPSLEITENTVLTGMIILGIVACVSIVGLVMVFKK